MAFVLREVPGVYLFVGSMNRAKGLDQPHHCARYILDEASLAVGVQVWLSLAGALLGGAGEVTSSRTRRGRPAPK